MNDDEKKLLLTDIEKKFKETIESVKAETITGEQAQAKFDEITKEINDKFVEKADFDSLKEKLESITEEVSSYKNIVKEQGDEITSLKTEAPEVPNNDNPIYFVDALKQAMIDEKLVEKSSIFNEAGEKVETMKVKFDNSMGRRSFKLQIPRNVLMTEKAAFDMTNATAFDPVAQINVSQDPNLVKIPNYNNIHVDSVYSTSSILTEYWNVLVETTETDGTATKAEDDVAAQSSFKIELVPFKCFTLATDYRITEQALADFNEFLTEMNRKAPDNLRNKLDAKVLGTNETLATDIIGIRNTTYAVGIDFSGTDSILIPSDYGTSNNICDVVSLAVGKATNANYNPNAVWMNDTDVRGLEGQKNADHDSITDRRMTFNNGVLVAIAGMRVLRNRNMPKNQLELTTTNELQIRNRSMIEMAMNYDQSGDFSADIITVKFRYRVLSAPRAQGAHVWVSNIETAISELDLAS